MEKTMDTEQFILRTHHMFYCDECGKYLGESQEYDDGWYDSIGEFETSYYLNGWYRMQKCLCDNCKKEIISKITSALQDLGFIKE